MCPDHRQITTTILQVVEGRVLDDLALLSTICKPGDSVAVLPRRSVRDPPLKPTSPAPTISVINKAIKDENDRRRAAADPNDPPIPEPSPSPPHPTPPAMPSVTEADLIQSLVSGNYEMLRGYLESIQETIARQGGAGGLDLDNLPPFQFNLEHFGAALAGQGQGLDGEEDDDDDDDYYDEEDEEEEDDEEGDSDEEHTDDEDEGSSVLLESSEEEAGSHNGMLGYHAILGT
jgi:hypothetical protein